MKKFCIFIFLATIFVSCYTEPSEKKEFKREELIGKWTLRDEESIKDNSKQPKIIEFILNSDSTANFKIQSEKGIKRIKGKWNANLKYNIFGGIVSFESGLWLSYSEDANTSQVKLVNPKFEGKRLIVNFDNLDYQKKLSNDNASDELE